MHAADIHPSQVLATIYTFKPQNASVSQLFCLIIAYVLGTAMHTVMPSRGYWRYLNPGPFSIKCVASPALCSAAGRANHRGE